MIQIKIEWAKDHRDRSLGFATVTTITDTGVQVDQIDQDVDTIIEVDLPKSPTERILTRLVDELGRQHAKWGEQNHPVIGSMAAVGPDTIRNLYQSTAVITRERNDRALNNKSYRMGWDDIIKEELYEAVGEYDADKAIAEFIQVAAVAINIALSIERNGIDGE